MRKKLSVANGRMTSDIDFNKFSTFYGSGSLYVLNFEVVIEWPSLHRTSSATSIIMVEDSV